MTVNGRDFSIGDLMRPVVTVHESDTLESILTCMVSNKRNSLVVVDNAGVVVGMVSATDVIKAVLPDYLEEDVVAARFANQEILKEDAQKAKGLPVSEFMNSDAPTIEVHDGVLEAASLALRAGSGRIIVVDSDKKPVGIITRTEIKQVIGSLLGIPGALE